MKNLVTVGLVCGCVLLAALYAGCGRSEANGKLQIMYSGNIRGAVAPCGCKTPKGGIARWAAFINRHRDADAAWLTVDAGNYVDRAGGAGGCTNKCQFMITSYEDLHYDVLNLGRQEVWMGLETLEAIMDTVQGTEFVSANLVNVTSGKTVAKPYVLKDYGKLRVGLLGLLNEADFPKTSNLMDTTKLRVESYMETARQYLPKLKRKADAVVVLCELSSAAIDSLVQAYPYIDLIISTGALRTGETLTTVGRTRVVGTGSSGYSGHYATLELNPAWSDSVGLTNWSDFLTDQYEEQGEWQDRLAAFNASAATSTPAVTPSVAPLNGSPTLSPAQPNLNSKPSTSGHEGPKHG